MTTLQDLLSSIDPTAKPPPAAPGTKTPPAGVVKPTVRPVGGSNGVSQGPPLKRKADSPPEGAQNKVIRKDGVPPVPRPNGSAPVRSASTPAASSSRPNTPSLAIPYRGTAGMGRPATTKTASPALKKPTTPTPNSPATISKPSVPTSKPSAAGTKPAATTAAATVTKAPPKSSYKAMLEKAKEVQKSKPAAPLIKHERTAILTKEERLALRAEAKGKKPAGAFAARPKPGELKTGSKGDVKSDIKDRRKSVETGYQGTARPVKKPIESGYKGTARPAAQAGPGKAPGPAAAKAKSKLSQGRYGGYASWSEEEDVEEEEEEIDEEGYESSDMEGGIWDVEQEEQLALKAAKHEDAEELAREMALKREKEERKRKLANLAKAQGQKRRF